MPKKYKDIVKLILYGRNDKLLTDTTSTYSGFDRTLTSIEGGGIMSVTANAIDSSSLSFTAVPNIYLTNETNKFTDSLVSTLSTNNAKVRSVTINTTPTTFTAAPTLFFLMVTQQQLQLQQRF